MTKIIHAETEPNIENESVKHLLTVTKSRVRSLIALLTVSGVNGVTIVIVPLHVVLEI